MHQRIGVGYDVHPLKEGRPLILGGIQIPHHKGPVGHSDGDVLIHAICDALLGAASLGDIGIHYPDSKSEFKNIDSKVLLARTLELIVTEGYQLGNVDCTVCLEQPRISKYIPSMIRAMSGVLHVQPGQLSVKATTTERLGFTGREEGISAFAVALLQKP